MRPATSIVQEARRVLPRLADKVEKELASIAAGRTGEERVRRTRAALRRLEIMARTLGCGYDRDRTAKLLKRVRRLKKQMGRVRDEDVMIRVVGSLYPRGKAGEERSDSLVLIKLRSRRARAAKKLRASARDEAGVVRERVRAMMMAPAAACAALPSRCAAAVVLAREAAAINAAARSRLDTPEALHALRLSLKEARTVLESMAPSLGRGAAALGGRLKELAGVLGAANDLAVAVDVLERMEKKGSRAEGNGARRVITLAADAHERACRESVVRVKAVARELAEAVRRLAFDHGHISRVVARKRNEKDRAT